MTVDPLKQGVRVTPVAGSLGAQVDGLQLRELSDEGFTVLHQALLDHQVVFVRGQHLTEQEHLDFASRWGQPMAHPVARLAGDVRVISPVEDTADSPPTADQWHSDITYWPEPPKIGVLCALTLPDAGGDTLWSSLYAAYDALSEPLRTLADGLCALHAPSAHFVRSWTQRHGSEEGSLIAKYMAGAVLPLVRTHDETGRQALFYTNGMTIQGVAPAENDLLMELFHNLVSDPNRSLRWRWAEGDVAIWDERCTNHRALSDHYPRYRLMRRCTIQGDRPFFRPAGAQKALIVARAAESIAPGETTK